jgi:hypothetical protein
MHLAELAEDAAYTGLDRVLVADAHRATQSRLYLSRVPADVASTMVPQESITGATSNLPYHVRVSNLVGDHVLPLRESKLGRREHIFHVWNCFAGASSRSRVWGNVLLRSITPPPLCK